MVDRLTSGAATRHPTPQTQALSSLGAHGTDGKNMSRDLKRKLQFHKSKLSARVEIDVPVFDATGIAMTH